MNALQDALFRGRTDVYTPAFLVDAAEQAGVPRAEAEDVLASDRFADAVRADREQALRTASV